MPVSARIGVFAPVYARSRVGVDVVTERLVEGLASEWEVWFYAWTSPAREVPGVRLRLLPSYLRRHVARLVWQNLRLPGLLRRDGIELVLATYSELPLCLETPAVAVVHDLTPLRVPESSPWKHRVTFGLAARLLQRAKALVTVSEYTRRDLLRTGWYPQTPIHVIYNGTDFPSVGGEETPSAQTARTPQSGELVGRQPFILYVGGFLAHKNVPTLLASFQELASALPHHLVLVGGGSESERKKLGPLAARLGIAERVHVYHGIPARELVALYRSCDLFVYPSRYEGFGLPVLEAMACGAPVLCSSATAMPEVGGDAVRYFSPDSRDELTAGMRAVLIDRGLREQLVARGLERAARFTWKRTVAAYSRVIREVLSRGTDRG